METVGNWFSDTYASLTGSPPQDHVNAVKSALNLPPVVSTDAGVARAAGTTADARGAGYTMTGGRRFKKTGRRGKKVRKTRRGRR